MPKWLFWAGAALGSQIALILFLSYFAVAADLVILQTTSNPIKFYRIVNSWEPSQYRAILGHFFWDFFHIGLYTQAFRVTLSRLAQDKNLLLAPLVVGAADILENIFHLIAISSDRTYPAMVAWAYACSLAKWSGVFLLFITILSLLAKKWISASEHKSE